MKKKISVMIAIIMVMMSCSVSFAETAEQMENRLKQAPDCYSEENQEEIADLKDIESLAV